MWGCKDCKIPLGPDYGMVMVHDKLWEEISDNFWDVICAKCMETRMGRKITEDDFKSECIPCNEDWLFNTTGKYSKKMQKDLDKLKK